MAQETFNMFWHGTSLSRLELVCMQSFLDRGHKLRVFTYDEIAVPAGAENADARRILPRERLFLFRNSPSAFSNIFRYKLLLQEGGWWVDTDVLCLKSDIAPCDYYWAEQEPGGINGAVFKAPASDPICARLLQLSEQRSPHLSDWGQLGPQLLTEVLSSVNPPRHAGATADVYPVHWLEAHFLWLPEFRQTVEQRTRTSTFLHLWHSIVNLMGILDHSPPTGSFLEPYFEKFGQVGEQPAADVVSARRAVLQHLSQKWVKRKCTARGRDIAELGLQTIMDARDRHLQEAAQ